MIPEDFKTERVNDHITRIFCFTTELAYLVEGTDRCALIDSGSGIGSMKAVVDKLTDKPVIVLLTHGHIDHALGAPEFGVENVYLNREDSYVYTEHSSIVKRMNSLELCPFKEDVTPDDLIPVVPCSKFHDLKAGQVFDLGGISIETYACPGHTRGSLCMLLREDRILLTGDACNYLTFMFEWYSTSITEYRASLTALDKATAGKYDQVLLSHGDGNGHKGIILDVRDVCDEIIAGTDDAVPFDFCGARGLMAKAIDPKTMQRVDGGRGNIVYHKDHI